MDDETYAATTTALGPVAFSGNLRARGMLLLLVPACALTWFLFWFFGPLWYIALALVIVGLAATLIWMQRISGVFSVHSDGLAISRGWRALPYFGARPDLYRWDEITAVQRRLKASYSIPWDSHADTRRSYDDGGESRLLTLLSRYEIVTRDGRRAVLDSRFGDITKAGDIVVGEVTRCLLPGLLDRYDRWEPVAFGPLTLRRGRLTFGPHDREWSAVAGLNVLKGILEVEYSGARGARRWRTPIRAIPNADLLFALLAQRHPDLWIAANPAHFAEHKYYRSRTSVA